MLRRLNILIWDLHENYLRVRREIPLDLIGIHSGDVDGGLATSEMPTVVRYGVSGYVHTNIHKLIYRVNRFIREWNELFELVSEQSTLKKTAVCS